jgi:hypothetical protein
LVTRKLDHAVLTDSSTADNGHLSLLGCRHLAAGFLGSSCGS